MYEAKIVEKDTRQGALYITVEFTNGVDLFREVFTTTDPSKTWLDSVIDDRLKQANKVVDFPIETISKHEVSPTLSADFEAKKQKEKADREKPNEEPVDPKEPKDPKEEVPVPVEPVTP